MIGGGIQVPSDVMTTKRSKELKSFSEKERMRERERELGLQRERNWTRREMRSLFIFFFF